MKQAAAAYIRIARWCLPSPFGIAIILTIVSLLLAWIYSPASNMSQIATWWYEGMWTGGLLTFTMQMMLILVLGHSLALSPPIDRLIQSLLRFCNSTAQAAWFISFFTILVALFNWGLGLIFGAIMARKIGEHAQRNQLSINYPFIAACGYIGLMVWHGGLSGSAPLTVASENHSLHQLIGQLPPSATLFSSLNWSVTAALLIILPLVLFAIGKNLQGTSIPNYRIEEDYKDDSQLEGIEQVEHSPIWSKAIALSILAVVAVIINQSEALSSFRFLTLNFMNTLLLALAILCHRNIPAFLASIETAIKGASGILMQFPLYFGIMGLLKSSGLVDQMSSYFVEIATAETFPFLSFLSAGILNVFVPSGGGQWQVQGPILIQAAQELGVSIPKTIMAFSYGDQLTNMLQPFWALPLLGITGLKAKDILPYTLILFVLGLLIFVLGLLIF